MRKVLLAFGLAGATLAGCVAPPALQHRPDSEAGQHPCRDLRVDLVDLGHEVGDEAEAVAVGPGELRRIAHGERAHQRTQAVGVGLGEGRIGQHGADALDHPVCRHRGGHCQPLVIDQRVGSEAGVKVGQHGRRIRRPGNGAGSKRRQPVRHVARLGILLRRQARGTGGLAGHQ